MKKHSLWALAVIAIASLSQPSMAAGDSKKGKDVFAEECGDCHSAAPGKNKKGPGLFGVMGRKAGSVSDFSGYSDAMKQGEITWSADKVDAYIAQPRKIVPGGKMKYDGLDDAAARNDVIAYLSTLK